MSHHHSLRFYITTDETRVFLCDLRDKFDAVLGGECESNPHRYSGSFRIFDPLIDEDLFRFTDIYFVSDEDYRRNERPNPMICQVLLRLFLVGEEGPGVAYAARMYAYSRVLFRGVGHDMPQNKRLFGRMRYYIGKKAHHPMYLVDEDYRRVWRFKGKATDDVVRVIKEGGPIYPNDDADVFLGKQPITPLMPDWWNGPPLRM